MLHPVWCRGAPPPKRIGSLFNIRQDVTSRAAYKYDTNSMVSLYVSTSGLVPAYEYNINSMVRLYSSTSGLVLAYKYKLQAPELHSLKRVPSGRPLKRNYGPGGLPP